MNHDRPSRHPRLILDENIDFSSLDILLRHGLAQRCSGVYQSWCKEKKLSDEVLERRQNADERKEVEPTMFRIKRGIVKWLTEQAAARYPCVWGCVSVRKLMAQPQDLNRGTGCRELLEGFIRRRDPARRPM